MRAITAEEIEKIAGARNPHTQHGVNPLVKNLPSVPVTTSPSYPFDSGPSNWWPSNPTDPVPPPGSGGAGGGGGGSPHAPDWQGVVDEAAYILTSLGFNLPAGWTIGYGQYFKFKNTETGEKRESSTYNPGQHDIEEDGETDPDTRQVMINDDSLSPLGDDQGSAGDKFTIYVDSDGNPSTSGTTTKQITAPQLSQLEAAIVTLAHEYYHAAVDAEQGVPNQAWTAVEDQRAQTQAYIALKAYEKANNLSH